jgi:multidrug transporter EmrE-like cation transporter
VIVVAANIALLLVYVFTSTAGLVLMKKAMAVQGYLSLLFASGLTLYLAGFGLWMLLLHRMPLSVAFPVASGALIVATQAAGILYLGEKMQPMHAAGAGLILLGLGVIGLAGRAA